MMFQRKVKDVYQSIHDAIRYNRIKDYFVIDVDFKIESYTYKALWCLVTSLSSLGIDKSTLKVLYIQGKMKLESCYSPVYHSDNIKYYLEIFRSFFDMEV